MHTTEAAVKPCSRCLQRRCAAGCSGDPDLKTGLFAMTVAMTWSKQHTSSIAPALCACLKGLSEYDVERVGAEMLC
jgi:hypothetical protein